MKLPEDDPGVRRWLAGLRESDRQGTPDFGALWQEARRRSEIRTDRRRATRLTWATVALAVISVFALALWRASVGRTRPLLDELTMARDLSSWRAPTDVFTELSGVRIQDSVPSLELTSVLLPETTFRENATADPHQRPSRIRKEKSP